MRCKDYRVDRGAGPGPGGALTTVVTTTQTTTWHQQHRVGPSRSPNHWRNSRVARFWGSSAIPATNEHASKYEGMAASVSAALPMAAAWCNRYVNHYTNDYGRPRPSLGPDRGVRQCSGARVPYRPC